MPSGLLLLHVDKVEAAECLGQAGDDRPVALAVVVQLEQRRRHQLVVAGHSEVGLLLQLDEEERRILRSLGMITAKPVLFVANVDDKDPTGQGPLVKKVRDYATANGGKVVVVCAKIESELAELTEADRNEMLAALGMNEPALHSVARAAYDLLGLQSYFTAGPKEIRAWTILKGATAPQAAGVIHTDFERGFIRAEIYSVSDLEKHKNEKAIREAGRMRAEGKSYVMADGDVAHFLFNV